MDFPAEVRRVILSPYVPCLKKLYDSVHHVDSQRLQLWARGNPCQIDRLAAAVLEGLEIWPYSMDLLHHLSRVPMFRDSVLRQNPLLLSTLLAKAVDSESGFEKYNAVCLSLVSGLVVHAIPSSFPAFLEMTVMKAAENPSAQSIRLIYNVLSGLGDCYIDSIPFDLLSRLQDEMKSILRVTETHPENLLCLAILALLASRSFSPSAALSEPFRQALQPAQQFFTAKRAQKTLDLIVLKAIFVCSNICKAGLENSIECLRLSAEVANTVNKTERQEWIANNSSKMKKLYERLTRPDLSRALQCTALDFVTVLVGELPLPKELTTLCQDQLLATSALTLSTCAIQKALGHIDHASINRMMIDLLALACRKGHPDHTYLNELENSLRLVSALMQSTESNPTICEALLPTQPHDAFLEQVHLFHQSFSTDQNPGSEHNSQQVCPATCVKVGETLRQQLKVLLIRCALQSKCGDTRCFRILSQLLAIQDTHILTRAECTAFSIVRKSKEERSSLFEAESTPENRSVSRDWREALKRQISRDAILRSEAIIRAVGEVCRELELRCENVERPFREEQARCDDLQSRLEGSKAAIRELEEGKQRQLSKYNELAANNENIRKEAEDREMLLKDWSNRFDSVRQEFTQAKMEAQRVSEMAIKSAREQDLAYTATLKDRDENYQNQAAELHQARKSIVFLEDEQQKTKTEHADRMQKLETQNSLVNELRRQVSDLGGALESRLRDIGELRRNANETQRDLKSKDDVIENMRETVSGLEKAISSREEEVGILRQTEEELRCGLSETITANNHTVSDLELRLQSAACESKSYQERFDNFVALKKEEQDGLKIFHDAAIAKLRQTVLATERKAALVEANKDSMILDLQKSVASLREDRDKRGKEFAEAQKLSRQLMSVIGKQFPTESSAGEHQDHDNTNSLSLYECGKEVPHEVDSEAIGESDSSDIGLLSQEDAAAGSSGRKARPSGLVQSQNHCRGAMVKNGRQQTTLRPRTSLQTPTARRPLKATPNAQNRRYTITALSRYGRGVLAPIDPSSGMLEPTRSEEDSFGGDDIFTSTDQGQISALKKKTPRPIVEDETTADL